MALGLKVLVVLFVAVGLVVMITVMPPDMVDNITCMIDVQGCMMSGRMGIPGGEMILQIGLT